MTQRVENGLTYNQTFDAENRLISVTVSGQTTQFVYNGDGNLVKKIKPDGSKTLYIGGIYEVDKSSGGSVTATIPCRGCEWGVHSTMYSRITWADEPAFREGNLVWGRVVADIPDFCASCCRLFPKR